MSTLRKLTLMLLMLVLTVSVASTSFAARKRTPKVKVEETAVEKKVEKTVVEEKVEKKVDNIKRNEETISNFEETEEGWEIPDWAWEKDDHVAQSMKVSKKYASKGKASLEIEADFPGKKWTGAYIEYVEYLDWSNYSECSVDIYIPADAPIGLMGKIILTVGEDWKWVEMRKPERLVPGEWNTIRANLMPGSTDWRRVQPDDAFRLDVRKVGVRVESDKKAIYKGSFYVDNFRLTILEK